MPSKYTLSERIAFKYASACSRAEQYGAVNRLALDDLLRIIRTANGCCSYCQREVGAESLTPDHVIPLSRGGSNTPDNIVAACPECNVRKGDRLLSEPMRLQNVVMALGVGTKKARELIVSGVLRGEPIDLLGRPDWNVDRLSVLRFKAIRDTPRQDSHNDHVDPSYVPKEKEKESDQIAP